MANINVDWEVEGVITPQESVEKMLKVIGDKDKSHSGTFWCWDGRVSHYLVSSVHDWTWC